MNPLPTLIRREWLQHRFGWSLMAGLPLGLGLLLVAFGQVHVESDEIEQAGAALPTMLALASIAASALLLFAIAWLTSAILVAGLSRRDHADRSIEFWLSLPVGHVPSLAVPLGVHLILVPAAALLVGLLGGVLVSLVLVTRVAGVGAWFSLPWGALLPAALAGTGRVLAGLLLATLWLAPIVMAVVLFTAWFRRWGLVIVGVGVGVGSVLLDRLFGQPLLSQAVAALVRNAGRSLVGAGHLEMGTHSPQEAEAVLRTVPGLALADLGHAVGLLASPLLFGGLIVAAGCFAMLVDWRRRGAQAAG
jgi:ABC-2 type transport system permease protein